MMSMASEKIRLPSDPVTLILFLPFYILFLPLILFGQGGGRLEPPRRGLPDLPKLPPLEPAALGVTKNVEVWSWVDYKGRERKITVEREVKEY